MTENSKTPMYKRVIARIGIIALLSTYFILFVMVIMGADIDYFMGALAATIAIPIFAWVCIWAFGSMMGRHTIASLDPLTSNKQHDKNGNLVPEGKIDTIVFDIGNVLANFAYKDFIAKKNPDKEIAQRVENASVHSKDWTEFDRAVLSIEEVVERFKKNDPEIADEIGKTFEDFDEILTKREKTIPWIRALKAAGYRVLYLSNMFERAVECCPDAMGFLDEADGGILSYTVNLVKPNHDIYELLAERYNLVPEKTVFIDDTPVNAQAARDLGWHAIDYKSYDQAVKELHDLGVRY